MSAQTITGIDITQNSAELAITDAIVLTFSSDIKPTSVTDSTVALIQDFNQDTVLLKLTIFGSTLTLKSTADLLPGSFYTLTADNILSSNNIGAGPLQFHFKTIGTFVPPGQRAYWSFENTGSDVIGIFDPVLASDVVGISYVPGRNANSGMAALFNGTTSIIQLTSSSGLLSAEFSISFWMYLDSDNHLTSTGKQKSSFVIGMANIHGLSFDVDSTYKYARFRQAFILSDKLTTMTNDFSFTGNGITYASDPSLRGDGIENATLENQGIDSTGIRLLLDKTWAQVVMTIDTAKTRSLYINGMLMYQQDLHLLSGPQVNAALQPLSTETSMKYIPDILIPASYNDKLVFGFWQSKESTYGGEINQYLNLDANHFKGMLDDVRIFNRRITSEEVVMMYNDEKP